MCHAGGWKPVPSVAAPSPQEGSSSDKLQEQLAPNHDVVQRERTSSSNEKDGSRSGSQEPNPGGSDCSEGSDEEQDSTSPVKITSKCQRSSSVSVSPEVQKKQVSKSPSPIGRRKLSRSTSSPRRSPSKSKSKRKPSRLVR